MIVKASRAVADALMEMLLTAQESDGTEPFEEGEARQRAKEQLADALKEYAEAIRVGP